MNRRLTRPLTSTNYKPLIANMPDVNNLYSMDEQIFEDKDDDEEVDTLDDLDGGQEESAMNNFLSNGSIAEEEYGRRKRVSAARLSQISRLKGL